MELQFPSKTGPSARRPARRPARLLAHGSIVSRGHRLVYYLACLGSKSTWVVAGWQQA